MLTHEGREAPCKETGARHKEAFPRPPAPTPGAWGLEMLGSPKWGSSSAPLRCTPLAEDSMRKWRMRSLPSSPGQRKHVDGSATHFLTRLLGAHPEVNLSIPLPLGGTAGRNPILKASHEGGAHTFAQRLLCPVILLFIYFWLCWAFVSVRGLSLVVHHSARASHYRGLSCCGAQAPDAQAQ